MFRFSQTNKTVQNNQTKDWNCFFNTVSMFSLSHMTVMWHYVMSCDCHVMSCDQWCHVTAVAGRSHVLKAVNKGCHSTKQRKLMIIAVVSEEYLELTLFNLQRSKILRNVTNCKKWLTSDVKVSKLIIHWNFGMKHFLFLRCLLTSN